MSVSLPSLIAARFGIWICLSMLSGVASNWSQAKAGTIDPLETKQALTHLFAASNEAIPESSSCHGDYGQEGKAQVKDLLAVQLAYLYSGKNTIRGNCDATRCSVTINHSAGEDVSSANVTFRLKRGKASISTLKCVMTP